eukprot:scaffold56317_cov84-Phaeocystis_antarctica.AAC.2
MTVETRLHKRRVCIDRAARCVSHQPYNRRERQCRGSSGPQSSDRTVSSTPTAALPLCRCGVSNVGITPAPLAPSSLGQLIGKTAASIQCGDSAQLNAS